MLLTSDKQLQIGSKQIFKKQLSKGISIKVSNYFSKEICFMVEKIQLITTVKI